MCWEVKEVKKEGRNYRRKRANRGEQVPAGHHIDARGQHRISTRVQCVILELRKMRWLHYDEFGEM